MANVEHSALTGSDLHEPKGVAAAAANKVYRTNGAGSGTFVYPGELIGILEDRKAQNTAGGTFTLGADRTRDLNTEVYDKYGIIAVSGNQFTITPPASSTYVIEWRTPANGVGVHQSLLFRTSGSPAEIARGSSAFASNSNTVQNETFGYVPVTISAATTYEIRHRGNATKTTDGFGTAANFGTEVYTQVKIYRVD